MSEMPLGGGGKPSPDFRIPLNKQTPDREEQSVEQIAFRPNKKIGHMQSFA